MCIKLLQILRRIIQNRHPDNSGERNRVVAKKDEEEIVKLF